MAPTEGEIWFPPFQPCVVTLVRLPLSSSCQAQGPSQRLRNRHVDTHLPSCGWGMECPPPEHFSGASIPVLGEGPNFGKKLRDSWLLTRLLTLRRSSLTLRRRIGCVWGEPRGEPRCLRARVARIPRSQGPCAVIRCHQAVRGAGTGPPLRPSSQGVWLFIPRPLTLFTHTCQLAVEQAAGVTGPAGQ